MLVDVYIFYSKIKSTIYYNLKCIFVRKKKHFVVPLTLSLYLLNLNLIGKIF